MQKILFKEGINLIRKSLDIINIFISSFIIEQNKNYFKKKEYVDMTEEGNKYIVNYYKRLKKN